MADKLLQIFGFLIGGLTISFVINGLLLRFSRTLGIRNKNDIYVRWSNQSKPSLGGISFYIVFVFSAIFYSILYDELIFHNREYVGLLGAASIAFLMGLADDAYNTRPLLKLLVQILCGITFVLTGSLIDLFHNFYLDATLTVVWVVLIMNSLNMLDNMDGITGTVVLFILLTCLFSNWMILDFNTNIWTLSIISVLGALVGFLGFNIHPSKLFMGDAGSQFIGLFVAFFAIHNLWNIAEDTSSPSWIGLVVTLIAFTPAAVDTLTVVINRLKRGQSPMVGGKDHTTHHLVYAGLTDFKVWVVFLLISIASMVLALAMINLATLKVIYPILLFVVFFVIVFYILYRNTIRFPNKK